MESQHNINVFAEYVTTEVHSWLNTNFMPWLGSDEQQFRPASDAQPAGSEALVGGLSCGRPATTLTDSSVKFC